MGRPSTIAILAAASGLLAACASAPGGGRPGVYRAANLKPYEVAGRRYEPKVVERYEARGLASWYAYPNNTRRTATGEWFDGRLLTAAHKTLPLPCIAEVENLDNGKRVRVRVNDRGPFVGNRLIDLSPAAAERLGFRGQGLARVKVKFLGPAVVADSVEIRLASIDQTGADLY